MKQSRDFTCLKTERVRYINRVFNFCRSHVGPSIDRFMIRFDLRASSANYISSWIRFALTKRVQRLELDLRVVNPRNLLEHVSIADYEIRQFYTLECFDFGCLTSLKLHTVNMSRETLEYILSNCPVLEDLSITKSPSLPGVRVTDVCPKLKHLEIAHCQSLEFLEISSAPNLISLSYTGLRKTSLCFSDVPNLVDVSLQGEYCTVTILKFHELHLPFSQIQKLKLVPFNTMAKFKKFPELKSVTELELEYKTWGAGSVLSCAYVIEACPNLSILSVKLGWFLQPTQRKAEEFATGSCNKCLKVVELSGFRGCQPEIDFATYIFSTSPLLKEISIYTVDPRYTVGTTYTDFSENLAAKSLARQLVSRFSPAARLHLGCAPTPCTGDTRPPSFQNEHLLV